MPTNELLKKAAQDLGVEVAIIQAVAEVESPRGAFTNGYPSLLFERHKFSKETGGIFDKQYPDISNKTAGGYGTYGAQKARMDKAALLNRDAALQSTSWGRFQIMGFNYKSAGFNTLDEFVKAMESGEQGQIQAFVNFVKNNNLQKHLQNKNWAAFAKGYNGADYARHAYDKKLEAAYNKYAGML